MRNAGIRKELAKPGEYDISSQEPPRDAGARRGAEYSPVEVGNDPEIPSTHMACFADRARPPARHGARRARRVHARGAARVAFYAARGERAVRGRDVPDTDPVAGGAADRAGAERRGDGILRLAGDGRRLCGERAAPPDGAGRRPVSRSTRAAFSCGFVLPRFLSRPPFLPLG